MNNNTKLKKTLVILAAAFLLATIWVIADIEFAATMVITNQNTVANSTNIQIPITLENNNTIYGIQFEIYHNTTDLIYKNVLTTNRTTNATIENKYYQERIRLALVTDAGITPGNGTILNLIFDVNETAQNSSVILNATELLVLDMNIEPVLTNTIHGNITIISNNS